MLSQVYFAAIERDLDSKIPIEFLIRRIAREIPLPIPGKAGIEFSLIDHDDPISISMHPLRHPLCSRFHFSFLFDSLSIDTVLGIFSSIVSEKRIIFHSSSLSRLTIISQCITQLLYPFKLSTIFIPVVPEQMIDIYQIPQPYLIGVHSKFLPQLFDLHGIVIVDLDHDIVRSTVELPRLPEEHGALLWQNLFDVLEMHIENNDVVSETSNDPFESENELLRQFDSQICEAFLIFYSSILNGYRKHLLFIDSVPVFNRNGFLLSKLNGDSGIDEFLNQFVQTRMFERFLQEDLDVEELQKDLYREFIASDAFEVLNEIRAIESRITKLYNLPKIECLSERDPEFEKFVETMSSSPFCNSLCKEFLEPTKKFKLKYVTDKKYKAFSRPRHFENDLNEHPGCLQLKLYLQSLFLEEEIGIDQRTEVEFSMRESEVRSCLGSILKQNTQKNSMIRLCKGSFEAFSRLLQICLHFSNNIDDFKCAYHILKASGSFYCDTFKSNGLMKRHFLSELIRDCNFWKKISFWDFVFENQLKETSNASSNSRDAETIDLKGDEFVVSSLMESAHWMIQFGMDSKCVEHQIFVIARRYKVSSQDLMTIKQLVHNISRVQT